MNNWVVVDTKVAPGEHTPVLGRFENEQEASEFIETLPEYESGRYGLDFDEEAEMWFRERRGW